MCRFKACVYYVRTLVIGCSPLYTDISGLVFANILMPLLLNDISE
jgi:hypothetical protein